MTYQRNPGFQNKSVYADGNKVSKFMKVSSEMYNNLHVTILNNIIYISHSYIINPVGPHFQHLPFCVPLSPPPCPAVSLRLCGNVFWLILTWVFNVVSLPWIDLLSSPSPPEPFPTSSPKVKASPPPSPASQLRNRSLISFPVQVSWQMWTISKFIMLS